MGTAASNTLASALFGKARRALLGLLYVRPDEAFYLRELIRAARVGQGAMQREVKRLSDAGIIERTARGREVYYRANPGCPIFAELKSMMVKTAGVSDVLRAALAPLETRIRVAFVYGSFAKGEQNQRSDIDVLVVGDCSFKEVVTALGSSQDTLGREIQPTVYPVAEFRARVRSAQHFVTSVLGQEKIFLIGDERELARLAARRLGHRAQKQRPGN
jgi:predicted nucleotidyltransferase